jgi:hypothetical protein
MIEWSDSGEEEISLGYQRKYNLYEM